MSHIHVDENKARIIAENFLQQHHSIIKVEKSDLQNDVWLVKVHVSSPHDRKFQVQINAHTGLVVGFGLSS